MAKRKIITIDQNKCNGCGLCIPNCPEGAIQIIDGKARLISDLFCDGLGACIGHCPEGAISIEEREAQAYDEKKVMENIVKQGINTIQAHLEHLRGHGEQGYLKEALDFLKDKGIKVPEAKDHAHGRGFSCPSAKVIGFEKKEKNLQQATQVDSELINWPVQIMLVPPHAPYLRNADILVAADCVPFAYANFHQELLKDKILLIGCPKLDNAETYRDKFKQMFAAHEIKSITYAHMEVPCCSGLVGIIKETIEASGKNIPFKEAVISIKGERLQ